MDVWIMSAAAKAEPDGTRARKGLEKILEIILVTFGSYIINFASTFFEYEFLCVWG